MHTVEDFHVLVDMCRRTMWSLGHVGLWTLWNTGMTLCFHFQCKCINVRSRKGASELRESQACQP